MKKVIYYILFASFLILPLNVSAFSYSLKDMNISIYYLDWHVFTRDNISNNPELNELGITYDYLNNFMNTNDVYLDAVQRDIENPTNIIEMFVIIKKVDGARNLHTYNNRSLNTLGEELKNKVNANSYDIYTVGKYKYIHIKYYDSLKLYNVDEYYTVINGYGYTILAQKINEFSSFDISSIRSIVDTTSFKYNSAYEKNSSNIWEKALVGAGVAMIIGGLSEIFNKKKKKQVQTKSKEEEGSICGHCGAIVKDSATKCPKCGVSFVDDEIDEEDNEVEEEGSICGHCRAIVKDSATKCPKCGVSFVDDEINEEDNEDEPVKEKPSIDQKYSDLKKLKELLDEGIITKEEFAKEKKKILK